MPEDEQAALDDNNFIIDGGEEPQIEDAENQQAESAPVEEVEQEVNVEEKESTDNFQSRIDKVTADKHNFRRQAEALQAQLDEVNKANQKPALQKPKLDDPDIDYDEEALEKANREYEINKGVEARLSEHSAQLAAQEQQAAEDKALATFNDRINALGKDDFAKKADSIPVLPNGVANAMMEHEQGAEMIYHLGQNPVLADAIANMSPSMAVMELGKLSVSLSVRPEIKTSAAPEPIETLKSGGGLSKERGPSGATYE